jgi:farnesyl diphosphate synthase
MPSNQFSAQKARCESFLKSYLSQQSITSERLTSAMNYSLFNGGKRIRAILVYITGEIFETSPLAQSHIAIALEMIHAFSLIHDDLPAMDDDKLRRGKPTCHIAYDEATAILAGDALQTLAFEALTDIPQSELKSPMQLIQAIKTLAVVTGHNGMTAGQMLDLQAEGKTLPLEGLENIHRHKTGALIKAAIIIPFILSDHYSDEVMPHLASFAELIGLAFQIQDDILDITTSTEMLGKQANRDIELEKSTYPALLGLESAKSYLEKTYVKAIQALENIPRDTNALQEISTYITYRNH